MIEFERTNIDMVVVRFLVSLLASELQVASRSDIAYHNAVGRTDVAAVLAAKQTTQAVLWYVGSNQCYACDVICASRKYNTIQEYYYSGINPVEFRSHSYILF